MPLVLISCALQVEVAKLVNFVSDVIMGFKMPVTQNNVPCKSYGWLFCLYFLTCALTYLVSIPISAVRYLVICSLKFAAFIVKYGFCGVNSD